MSLVEFVKKQLIDIIEWTEVDDRTLVWRFPTADREIQQGAQLVVRETQSALFVDQGQLADLFGPGRYTIRTANLPVLTDLRHWTKGFESPFKSEVYFFSTRLRLNQTWGTASPIAVRDREFGAARVRAFGIYSYRIADARRFYARVAGTRASYGVDELEGQLRSTLVTTFAVHLGESDVPFLDMAGKQDELAAAVHAKAAPLFADLGLALDTFQVQSVSLPDDLGERLDERIGMGIAGDLGRYGQFQAARSVPIAAAAGGTAGAGVGMGVGVAMGQTMARAVTPPAAGIVCKACNATLERATKFCPECGGPLA